MIEEGTTNPSSGDNKFTKLYKGDGSHPNNLGSYLAACVIVATMTGEDRREWIWKPDSLNEEERDSMQEYAWRAIQDFASEQHTMQQPAIPSSRPIQHYTCIDLNRKSCIKSTTCKWIEEQGCEEVSFVETSSPTSKPTPIDTDILEEASESVVISASPTQVPTTLLTNEVSIDQTNSITDAQVTNPSSPTQQSIDTSMKTETMPESKGSRNIPLSAMLIIIEVLILI